MPEEQVNDEASSEIAARSYADFPARTFTTLGRTLSSVLVVGRELLERRRASQPSPQSSVANLLNLCADLLEHRGEASGLALASEVAQGYQTLPTADRLKFFSGLATDFDVDRDAVLAAVENYREDDCIENLWAINHATQTEIIPQNQYGPRGHPHAGGHARSLTGRVANAPAIARCGFRPQAPLHFLVQQGLSGIAAYRLVLAGQRAGKDYSL